MDLDKLKIKYKFYAYKHDINHINEYIYIRKTTLQLYLDEQINQIYVLFKITNENNRNISKINLSKMDSRRRTSLFGKIKLTS